VTCVTKGHQQSYDACDFLLTFHTNYASILYHFQDIASYFLQVAHFFTSRVDERTDTMAITYERGAVK